MSEHDAAWWRHEYEGLWEFKEREKQALAADRDGWVAVARQLADALDVMTQKYGARTTEHNAEARAALAAFRALDTQVGSGP